MNLLINIGNFSLIAAIYMYIFLQPIAFFIYIFLLVGIWIQGRGNKEAPTKLIIILNQILWWVSLGPSLTLFSFIIFTDVVTTELLMPIFFTWYAVSLFFLAGFIVKVWYKKSKKPMPLRWYKFGLWWYGFIFLSTIVCIIVASLINIQKN